MTTSGQICKMSYTAYCNMYCNMGQPYCNTLFALLFHPYKLRHFYTMWRYMDVVKPSEKETRGPR